MPIFINDLPGLSIMEFRNCARQMVKDHNVKAIFLDYLQLMTSRSNKGQNREQEISEISRQLKITCKELKVPIIALSQLSRAVESRSDKKPILSDLRESGSIEQDADIVMFLFRPFYYGIERDEDGTDVTNLTEIIVSKHRNGAIGSKYLEFEAKYTRFSDQKDQYIEDTYEKDRPF